MNKESLKDLGILDDTHNTDEALKLLAAGIPVDVVKFTTNLNRANGRKRLNMEGVGLGDTFTLKGFPQVPTEGDVDGTHRAWNEILTSGDRDSISLSRLVGTPKRVKYFYENESAEWYNGEKVNEEDLFTLSQYEPDALVEVANALGTTIQCVAIAENCGKFNSEFMLFRVVGTEKPKSNNSRSNSRRRG